MTSPLRSRVVEAIHDAVLDSDAVVIREFSDKGFTLEDAALVLGAMLDCLTENADEWQRAAWEALADTDPDVFGSAALAVLREDR